MENMKTFDMYDFPKLHNEWRMTEMSGDQFLRSIGYTAGFEPNGGFWFMPDHEYTFFLLKWGYDGIRD